jgi:ribosomal protein S18 acetylase RimI-like enzyme
MQNIRIIEADLNQTAHQEATLNMVDAYSRDAMGDVKPLAANVRATLIDALRKHPTTIVFLAFDGDLPVGVAVCFRAFSTFAAKQIINIHDLHVLPSHQRRGIGHALIRAVEDKARSIGAGKISLEVLENNHSARKTYAAAGFSSNSDEGLTLYLTKSL